MTLDLNKGSNAIFDYYIQEREPKPWWLGTKWIVRLTWWTRLRKKNGKRGVFFSLVMCGHFQTYLGTAKCDATRTTLLNDGQLGEARPGYVMTGWRQEHASFRWRKDSDSINTRPDWKGMGSS